MKLSFEHGLDSFAWDDRNRPAPGQRARDTGIEFWLDGELLQAIAKTNPVAKQLQAKIDLMLHEGWTKAQIRNYYRRHPDHLLPGIEIFGHGQETD